MKLVTVSVVLAWLTALVGCAGESAQPEPVAEDNLALGDGTRGDDTRQTRDTGWEAMFAVGAGQFFFESDFKTLQEAICVPEAEIGTLGPRTKVAYAIYETWASSRPWLVKDATVSNTHEFDRAVRRGACDTSRFMNIFEAEQFDEGNRFVGVLEAMREDGVPGLVDHGTDLAANRDNIARANAFFEIQQPDGSSSNELTPALYKKLQFALNFPP